MVVAMYFSSAAVPAKLALSEAGKMPALQIYCAAFTSFQISTYFARRGTSCQK
jgi:hypothetical protein